MNQREHHMVNSSSVSLRKAKTPRPAGFTLLELLVTMAIIVILAGLLSTAFAKAQGKAQGITCLANVRQLSLAWVLYSGDNGDRLPYNLGGSDTSRGIAPKRNYNWMNNPTASMTATFSTDWMIRNGSICRPPTTTAQRISLLPMATRKVIAGSTRPPNPWPDQTPPVFLFRSIPRSGP